MFLNETILTLLSLQGIGPSFVMKHRTAIGKGSKDEQRIIELVADITDSKFSTKEISTAQEKAKTIIDFSLESGINIINFDDLNYPKQLQESSKYPMLYLKGNLPPDRQICGIIGSRESTEIGRKIAAKISRSFQSDNYYILSGLAEGIDQATYGNEVSLKSIIGVLPGGLAFNIEKTLAKGYSKQAQLILEGGGTLISSFPPATKQDNYKLSEYCKLQANLSNILILVQSRMDGGSRFTVEEFSKLPRNLGIIDGSLFEANSEAYEANSKILDSPTNGLAEFAGTKTKKIKTNVIRIKSKEDYKKLQYKPASQKSIFDL